AGRRRGGTRRLRTQECACRVAESGAKGAGMKALVYTAVRKLEWQDWPDPQLSPGEALVRVGAVGVCGSDIHGWTGHSRGRVPPLVLGHEMSGIVEGIEGNGGKLKPGDLVAIFPLIGC